jgi:predicted ATPase/class 3 adenylate cyclase
VGNPVTVSATAYPTGTVTFLFTDIGGSTRLWERAPEAMRGAVAAHYAILSAAVEEQGGVVFKTVGDAVCAAFGEPAAAVAAGIEGQRRLSAHAWPSEIGPIEVRMAIHTGVATATDGDYFGPTLNRVARLMSLAYPGQVIVSRASTMLLTGGLPAGVQLRELGVFRLKDLSEPEPTAQVIAEGLRPEFPPLASLDARPNNLPFQIASFVGRESELREIQEALGTHRLITIVGPGGIGKTRLALQVAANVTERFKDGMWFVDLSSLTGPELVAQAIGVVLNVREESQRPLEETLVDAIGTKALIIVLDGVDRVLSGAASLAKKLLSRCAALQIIATGREPLHLTGERTVRIGPLGEVSQLFLERAREVEPAIGTSPGDAKVIAEICSRLDGIPLAVELAAAHVATNSLGDLLTRLSKSLKLLVSRDTTKDERHRTLRATISWSYDLLPEAEAAAVCALSVFDGSFDIAAASAILGENEENALSLVEELSVKSMLAVVGGVKPARYSMMSTVREYLRDVTVDEERARAVALRHFEYFDKLAAEHANVDAKASPQWLSRIDDDIVNVRAAVEWGIREARTATAELVAILAAYWKARGFLKEGRAYFRRALELPLLGTATRARLLRRAASFAIEQDDYDEARAMNLSCRLLYEKLGDPNGVAETYHNVGVIEQRLGQLQLASDNYDRAIGSFRLAHSAFGEAMALHNVVLLALDRGDLDFAQARIDEAADALGRASDEALAARFTALAGHIALKRRDFAMAETHYRSALAVQANIGSRLEIAVFHKDLATALVGLHRLNEARDSARICLKIAQEIDSSALLIYAFQGFCRIALDDEQFESAARLYALVTDLRETHKYEFSPEPDFVSIGQTLRDRFGDRFDVIAAQAKREGMLAAADALA